VLPGWAVESGDHPGVFVGETTTFALEFAPVTALRRIPSAQRSFDRIEEDRYRVCGRVDVATSRLTVVDVGSRAFAARRVECEDGFLEVGDWFAGEILLAVDPFTYRRFHSAAAGAFDMTRSWTIESIQVQADGGESWSPVDSTPGDSSVLYLLSLRPGEDD
jgi:hypothetical protein